MTTNMCIVSWDAKNHSTALIGILRVNIFNYLIYR